MQERWHFLGSVPENYERYLVPRIFAPWAEDLVEAAALRAGERVLDIACGTGIVARIAARRLGNRGSIVGLDTSAPMLATARAAATAEGAAVEWREGDALEQPFTDGAFEVVLCQQGLQFFPDKPRGLREMYRVLRPGGRMVLSVWGPIERSPGFGVLAEALTRHVGSQAGGLLTSGPFSLSDADELRTLIAGANFQDIDIRRVTKTLHYAALEEQSLRSPHCIGQSRVQIALIPPRRRRSSSSRMICRSACSRCCSCAKNSTQSIATVYNRQAIPVSRSSAAVISGVS